MYIHTPLLSVPQSWSCESICPCHQTLTRTPWMAQENDPRLMTHSHIISSGVLFSFDILSFHSHFLLLFFSWCHGTMRHAQVQHAQQRVPCHVFVESQSCTHRYMAQVFEIVLTCCGTDQHERGSRLAALWMISPPFGNWWSAAGIYRSSPHSPCTCWSWLLQLHWAAQIPRFRQATTPQSGHHLLTAIWSVRMLDKTKQPGNTRRLHRLFTVLSGASTSEANEEADLVSSFHCVHTLSCRTHIFFAWRTDIAYTHGSRLRKRFVAYACRWCPSRLLHVPPSILVVPGRSRRHHVPGTPSSSSFTRPISAGQAHFRTSAEEFGYLADPTHSTGYEPKQTDKTTSATVASLISRKPHARTVDCSVFPQFLKPLFRKFLMVKAKTACIGKSLQDKEKERKEKVLWSVLQSRCQGKVGGTVLGVILFRVTENSILMNEISENSLNEELKLFLVKTQFRGNYTQLSTHGDPKSGPKKLRICINWVTAWAWISKTTVIGGQSMNRASSTICVTNWWMKDHLHQESHARSCREIEELKRRCYQEENIEKQRRLEAIPTQHDQESRTVSLLRDQVRRLQERLEFFEDPKIFHDPDSLSSYDSTYAPHQALISSSSNKSRRESRMLRNTWEFLSISGNVFDYQSVRPVPEESHNDSRNLATPSGIQKREGIEKSGSEEPLQTIPLPCFSVRAKEKKSRWKKLSYVYNQPCRVYWDLHSKWHDNSELSFLGDASGKFHDHNEFQSWIVNFRREVCSKAKNPTVALQWIKEIEADKSLDDLITPKSIMKNWIWWWRQHCQGATISKHTSERRSVSKSKELKRTTDFSEGDKLLIWSTNIFDLQDPMMKFKVCPGCSVLNWRTTTFRTLIYVWSKHCYWQVILHRTRL